MGGVVFFCFVVIGGSISDSASARDQEQKSITQPRLVRSARAISPGDTDRPVQRQGSSSMLSAVLDWKGQGTLSARDAKSAGGDTKGVPEELDEKGHRVSAEVGEELREEESAMDSRHGSGLQDNVSGEAQDGSKKEDLNLSTASHVFSHRAELQNSNGTVNVEQMVSNASQEHQGGGNIPLTDGQRPFDKKASLFAAQQFERLTVQSGVSNVGWRPLAGFSFFVFSSTACCLFGWCDSFLPSWLKW